VLPGTGKPLVVAHACPGLYRALTCTSAGAAAAASALYARWEALTLEAAVCASMLQRAAAATQAAGAAPFRADPRERLAKGKRYVRLADRPREPTVAARWRALGPEERARVAAQHPHNTARLVRELEALQRIGGEGGSASACAAGQGTGLTTALGGDADSAQH